MSRSEKMYGIRSEKGFVLVAALACLAVLSLIGIAAMHTSNIEKTIAQNVNLAEKTFYRADGGTEVGIEMIEWNLSCPLGFTQMVSNDTDPDAFDQIRGVLVADSTFAFEEEFAGLPWDPVKAGHGAGMLIENTPAPNSEYPSDAARSIVIAENPALALAIIAAGASVDNVPHTNVALFGLSVPGAGSALQMAAGYEGKGEGAAGGGAVINYGVFAQTFGLSNSQAIIRLGWQHLVGTEGNCRPY